MFQNHENLTGKISSDKRNDNRAQVQASYQSVHEKQTPVTRSQRSTSQRSGTQAAQLAKPCVSDEVKQQIAQKENTEHPQNSQSGKRGRGRPRKALAEQPSKVISSNQIDDNNKQRSFGSPMHHFSRHIQNSILGSEEQIQFQQPEDLQLFSGDSAESGLGKRDHLKRRAKVSKHSKYDESSFLVDFSGNNNKLNGSAKNMYKSGTSTVSKISPTSKYLKREAKINRKTVDKQNQINEANVFSQIQQIKIGHNELQRLTKDEFMPSENINYSYDQKRETQGQDCLRFGAIGHKINEHMISNIHEAELTAATNMKQINRLDISNFNETQQNLIRHQQLNPHLYKRGPTKYQKQQTIGGNNTKAKGHWTEAEDKKLTEAVQANGGKNWKRIAESLKGRTDVQCLHRWQKVLNPSLVKGPWTDIEDRLLLHLVNIDGPQKWTVIANHLPGRIGKQCRERWHNHLNPMIKRQANWTPEEEWILFLLNRDLANKWADIANILEGRTDNTIKNHWNSSMKKRIKEISDEFTCLFKQRVHMHDMKWMGAEPVETNELGDPVNKSKVPKGYTREYIKLMKEFEQQMLNEKSHLVKEQNRQYYNEKCKELIANSENDSFCRAAANLMLNSGSEYLVDLHREYKGKLQCTDMNLLDEGIIPVDEQQVSDMIDKVCKQEQVTPIQAKVENYESSMIKTRGLETDKENIQMNKLKKKKQLLQNVNQFSEIGDFGDRIPFSVVDQNRPKKNVLQDLNQNSSSPFEIKTNFEYQNQISNFQEKQINSKSLFTPMKNLDESVKDKLKIGKIASMADSIFSAEKQHSSDGAKLECKKAKALSQWYANLALMNMNWMHHMHTHTYQKSEKSDRKPISADSIKIGASVLKQHPDKDSSETQKQSNQGDHQKTPKIQSFNLANVHSNIKVPIPQYVPNKLLFSSNSDAKDAFNIQDSEKKSVSNANPVSKIMQFGHGLTPLKDESQDRQPTSLADLCVNTSLGGMQPNANFRHFNRQSFYQGLLSLSNTQFPGSFDDQHKHLDDVIIPSKDTQSKDSSQ